jgi:hypothetical protein
MYALLAMSIVLVMLVVAYFLTIRRGTVVSSGFMAGRRPPPETGLSRSPRRFESPRGSDRARRPEGARFHNEESER